VCLEVVDSHVNRVGRDLCPADKIGALIPLQAIIDHRVSSVIGRADFIPSKVDQGGIDI